MRAILLASATATSILGLRASIPRLTGCATRCRCQSLRRRFTLGPDSGAVRCHIGTPQFRSSAKANFCLVMVSTKSMSYPETQLAIKIG